MHFEVKAQEFMRNNKWCIGFAPTVVINANNFTVHDTLMNLGLVNGNSNISDTNGNLLLICNGFYIIDKKATSWLQGGDSINTPFGTKFKQHEGGAGYWNQMSIILPKKANQYYVFTSGMSDVAFEDWQKPNATFDDFRFDVLTYHVVDMDSSNGQGKVVSQNNVLMQNARLSHNRMTVVRHANGRDWWLVKPHKEEQKFYMFLVQPDYITLVDSTKYNADLVDKESNFGQSTFNDDGDKYAFLTESYSFDLFYYDFDRCTGKFSNYKKIKLPIDTINYFQNGQNGVAFSPNNRFLYVSTNYHIFQIDLLDSTTNNIIEVGGPDTSNLNYFQQYQNLKLASNGKIYIGNFNGVTNTMSYIDSPNNKGLSCSFKPRGIRQPYTNLLVPPNMPNYGLGALVGSACDTLHPVQPQPDTSYWACYPNPTQSILHVKCGRKNNPGINEVTVRISNMLGQLVINKRYIINHNNEVLIDMSPFTEGVYTLSATLGTNQYKAKFVRN